MIEDGGLVGVFDAPPVSLTEQMRHKAEGMERRGFGAHVSLLTAYGYHMLEDSGANLRELSTPIEQALQRAEEKGINHLDLPIEEQMRIQWQMDGHIGRVVVGALLPTIEGIAAKENYAIGPFAARMELALSGTVLKSNVVLSDPEHDDLTPELARDIAEVVRQDKTLASVIREGVLPIQIKEYLNYARSFSGRTFMELAVKHLPEYEWDAQELMPFGDTLPNTLSSEHGYKEDLRCFVNGLSDEKKEESVTGINETEVHDVFTAEQKGRLKTFLESQS